MSDRDYLQSEFKGEPTLNFMPQILDVDGDKVWVDNVVSLGDLIEQKMGRDVSELYFAVVSGLVDEVVFGAEEDGD